MTTLNLAKIERVDLREAWPNEARDFTPWLAENIAELGEALGMDLLWEQTHSPMANQWLEMIQAQATSPDGESRSVIVLIENQPQATNSDNLGQVVTYAALNDPTTIVWLTREFREDHRVALDWLNERIEKDVEFFGVVVELWRIGDSLPALHFNMAVAPRNWRKQADTKYEEEQPTQSGEAIERPNGQLTREERYREFFQRIGQILEEEHEISSTFITKAMGYTFWKLKSAHESFRESCYYVASFGIKQGLAKVALVIDNTGAESSEAVLNRLEQDRAQIEQEFGEILDWQQENLSSRRVSLSRLGTIDVDEETLAEIQDWMIKNLLKFREVFDPRLPTPNR